MLRVLFGLIVAALSVLFFVVLFVIQPFLCILALSIVAIIGLIWNYFTED